MSPLPDSPHARPVVLPYPSLGALFKGRDRILDRLRASLARSGDGRATAIVGQALQGSGGQGKTRLAVEYAWRHLDDYSAIFFVGAATKQDLRRNLARLTDPFALGLPAHTSPEEEVRLSALRRWLDANKGWLLILDGVDTAEVSSEAEELLSRHRGGRVLLTSRLAKWGGRVTVLDLDVLPADDAARFLLERTEPGRQKLATDAADAAVLARELGGLPLALDLAAACIAQRRLSLADYLRDWRANVPAVRRWHDASVMKFTRGVAVACLTSLTRVGSGEVALLQLLSWLAPEPLPLFALENDAALKIWREAEGLVRKDKGWWRRLFVAAKPEPAPAGEDLRGALQKLADYELLRWDVEGQAASAHRVIQEIWRNRVPEAKQNAWLRMSLRLLDAATSVESDDERILARNEALQPHLTMAVTLAEQAGIAEPTDSLMSDLGYLLSGKGLNAEAEPLYRRSIELGERNLGPDHATVGMRLNNLAALLADIDRLKEAESMYRRALEIDIRILGPDHTEVATGLNNLAELLRQSNRPSEAEPLYLRALEITERNLGPDHPKVAIRLNNLALLFEQTDRLEEAAPLWRRSLAINERNLGPDHPTVARDLNNLGLALKHINLFAEAEPHYRRSLELTESILGPDHPNVAICLKNLAILLQETDRVAEAEPLCRRSVTILLDYSRRTGQKHPCRREALRDYRSILKALGRSKENIRMEINKLKAGER